MCKFLFAMLIAFSGLAFSAEETSNQQKVAEKLSSFYQIWNGHKTLQSFYDAELIQNLSAESQKIFLKKYGKIMNNPMPPAVVVGNTLLIAHPKNKFPDQISIEYANSQFLISFNDQPIISPKDAKSLENWFIFNGLGLTSHTSHKNTNDSSSYYSRLFDRILPKAQAQIIRCDSYVECYRDCESAISGRVSQYAEERRRIEQCVRDLMESNGLEVGNADSARMRREESRRGSLLRSGSSFGEVATLALSFAGVKKTGEQNSLTPLSEFLKQHNAVVTCTNDSAKKISGVNIDVDLEPIRSELRKVNNSRIDYTIKSKDGLSLDVYVTESNGVTIEKYQLCDAAKKCSALSGQKKDLIDWLIKFFPDPKLEAKVAKDFLKIRDESSAAKSKDFVTTINNVCNSSKLMEYAKAWRKSGELRCNKGTTQCSNEQLKADCLAASGESGFPDFKEYVMRKTLEESPKTRFRMPTDYRESLRKRSIDSIYSEIAYSSEEIDKLQAEALKREQVKKAETDLADQISRSRMTTLAYGCCLKSDCKAMLEQNNALLKAGAAKASGGAKPAAQPAKR